MALPQIDVGGIASASGHLCGLTFTADAGFNLSALVNLTHFLNTIQASQSASCCDLVTLIPASVNTIETEIDAILKNLGILGPQLGLLKIPTNLGGVIGWISKFVSTILNLHLDAFIKKEAQLAALIGQVAGLASAMEHALSNLGGCAEAIAPKGSITIPGISFAVPGSTSVGHPETTINFGAGSG